MDHDGPGIDPSQTLLYWTQFFFFTQERVGAGWRQQATSAAETQVDDDIGPALYGVGGPLGPDDRIAVVHIREGRNPLETDTDAASDRTADVVMEKPDGSLVYVVVTATMTNGPDWYVGDIRAELSSEAPALDTGWTLGFPADGPSTETIDGVPTH